MTLVPRFLSPACSTTLSPSPHIHFLARPQLLARS